MKSHKGDGVMRFSKWRRPTFLRLLKGSVLIFLLLTIIWCFFNIFLPLFPMENLRSANNLDSKSCVIPTIPLRSSAYNENMVSVPEISQCNQNILNLTQLFNNGTLKFLRSDLYSRKECTAYEILRPENLSNDLHELRQLGPFDETNQIHSIGSEYVMVACGSDTLRYSYHARVLSNKESIATKIRHWEDERGELPINVMMLVLDSTSANDAFRHLPLTTNFLLEKLNFIHFKKYHALGEPTMFNAIPLLTGSSAVDLFKERKWTDEWDNVNFIWNEFQNSQYVTSYMEDIPFEGTFNYGLQVLCKYIHKNIEIDTMYVKVGFSKPPTEIYPRPLFSAWEINKKEKQKCIGDSSLWKFIYNYELDILRTFDGIAPTLTIPWLVWPFHDHFGTLSALDSDTLSFFQEIASSPSILENTLIILMADHGFYSHAYSSTHAGLIERRLPLFMLRIPEKLAERVPNITSIIKSNSKRVTSHYDVYQTLLQVSKMAGGSSSSENEEWAERKSNSKGPGRSLFQTLPKRRTCRDAGIPDTWCACNLPGPPPVETVIPDNVYLDIQPFHLLRVRDIIIRVFKYFKSLF